MKSNRYLCIGPGGRKCACCFPSPGSKERRFEYRKAKRLEKKEALKVEDFESHPQTDYYLQWDEGYTR